MLKIFWRLIKSLLLIIILCAVLVTLFVQFSPVFGGKPDALSKEKMSTSVNFNGHVFKNSIPTVMRTPSDEEFSIVDFFKPPKDKNPTEPLPSQAFDKDNFNNGDFVWFGHSTVLLRSNNVNIITDPVFYNAAPISFAVKPFAMQIENTIDDLPQIDIVLISHDHYDHLDYRAIKKMDAKVKKYLVPLGVKAHLQRWGVSDSKVIEMDWHQDYSFGAARFTLTPARHFSGRGLTNRFSTLWGSWVIQTDSLSVFFSGDSGYFDEFKKIGEKYGPFDIAFLEDGAYNKAWSQIHMHPEESVRASVDLKSKVYVPIHWGKFDLAAHKWREPILRAKAASLQSEVEMATPIIGQVFKLENLPQSEWWKSAGQ